jgi:hypothetical protein
MVIFFFYIYIKTPTALDTIIFSMAMNTDRREGWSGLLDLRLRSDWNLQLRRRGNWVGGGLWRSHEFTPAWCRNGL